MSRATPANRISAEVEKAAIQDLRDGMSQRAVSRKYGIAKSTVGSIWRRAGLEGVVPKSRSRPKLAITSAIMRKKLAEIEDGLLGKLEEVATKDLMDAAQILIARISKIEDEELVIKGATALKHLGDLMLKIGQIGSAASERKNKTAAPVTPQVSPASPLALAPRSVDGKDPFKILKIR